MAKAVIKNVRFSYANVWEPKSINGSDPKYSVAILIPKTEVAELSKIQQAVQTAIQEGSNKIADARTHQVIPATLKLPLRDGDAERPGDEVYAGHYFINANSSQAPQIVDASGNPIINRADFYSGCYGYVSVNFYAFNTNGNKGIACGLSNIMKRADGEQLGGQTSAEADFADFFDAPSATAPFDPTSMLN